MSDHLSDTFRANVRAALANEGISPTELSRRMGKHHTYVGAQWRNGTGFTLETVDKYATALGIAPAVLLTPGGVQRQRSVRVTG